jgi:hypothetical protein
MAAFSHTKLAGSSWLQRRLPQETKYVLPESIAETRSLLHLLDGVAHTHSPAPRFLRPSAAYFRSSVNSGGRALQSSNVCAALLLADTNEDYIAQVAPCSSACHPPSRHVTSPYRAPQALASAATFTGSWDMRGGDADALTSLERTVLRKKLAVSERSRMFTLACRASQENCYKITLFRGSRAPEDDARCFGGGYQRLCESSRKGAAVQVVARRMIALLCCLQIYHFQVPVV